MKSFKDVVFFIVCTLLTLMLTALCLLLYAPMHRLYFGKTNSTRKGRNTREVKSF